MAKEYIFIINLYDDDRDHDDGDPLAVAPAEW